jgi:hypothetical protein
MNRSLHQSTTALLCSAVVVFAVSLSSDAIGADKTAGSFKVPRTLDGHPDLQGVWTSATITPLERPEKFGNRLVITASEAQQLEGAEAGYNAEADAPSDLSKPAAETCRSGSGPTCGYNNFWIDRGTQVMRLKGEARSSLLVEPANGRIPALTPERQKSLAARRSSRGGFDGPEARPLGERCLLAFGSSSGPPMLPVLYNNHYQIVQNKDTVMILVEMVHDARIVRMNAQHAPKNVRKWMGDSIGRWEGDTLVVETTNFTDKEGFRGATQDAKITERFTRVAPDQVEYRFTVEDSAAFQQPFSGEIAFSMTNDSIFEYACHEGNYALPGILAGAREDEKIAAQRAKQPVSQSGSK